jgi:hypothetical protein
MRGVKKGFIRIGEEKFVREDSIAAIVFGVMGTEDDAHDTAIVHLNGGGKLTFKSEDDSDEILELRQWLAKPSATVSNAGFGPEG